MKIWVYKRKDVVVSRTEKESNPQEDVFAMPAMEAQLQKFGTAGSGSN